MSKLSYKRKDGSLTHEHFQLKEFIQTAEMRWNGLSDQQIITCAKSDNIFQFPTKGQIGTFTRGMLNRLDSLENDGLVELVANGSSEQAAQINVYAMMRVYDVVASFMTQEIGERFATLDYTLDSVDVNAFLTRYRSQSNDAASWSDGTVKRIRSVLTEILVKSGLLTNPTSTDLIPMFIDPDLRTTVQQNGDSAWLSAFNCMEALK